MYNKKMHKKGGNDLSKEMIKMFNRNYTYEEKDTKIKELINKGFDINQQIIYENRTEHLNTLFYVCKIFCNRKENQTIENIQLVLENGADINFKNSSDNTPLLYCLKTFDECKSNLYNLIDFLIDEGANVNSTDDFLNTPLHIVCVFDDFKLIELLLDSNNADINAVNSEKETPLMIYCRDNDNFYVENFNYFIGKGANINIINDEEDTLLSAFSFNCNYDGALNLFKQDNFKYDVQMLNNALIDVKSCDTNENYKFIELLIEKGAEIKLINIPHFFGEKLPFIFELKPPEKLEIIETLSNIEITEGFDFYQYDNVDIDDFITEHGDNALVFYLKINDNKFKTALINKKEQLISGYNDRSNVFYKCKDFNKKNNFKNNVEFNRPYYKLQLGEIIIYIHLDNFLKIVKSSHKYWIINENKHDMINSLCSRSNLLSNKFNEEGYALNYDGNEVNLVSGFHCEVDKDQNGEFKHTPFNSYITKPTNRIVKNKKTPPVDTGSPKKSPPSSHTIKRKTPSPPNKTKKLKMTPY
jgi:ankyrin repeat protein